MSAEVEKVLPPLVGSINVLSITTSASAAQDTGINTGPGAYFTILTEADSYISFASTSAGVTDPDGTATSGNGRTWFLTAKSPQHFWVTPNSRFFKLRGTASTTARWFRSGA